MKKIVITGGPCAGKSAALQELRRHFTRQGYTVHVLTETATEMLSSGITPKTVGSVPAFQEQLARRQLQKEQEAEALFGTSDDKTLLFCDRGLMDGKGYLSDAEFAEMLDRLSLSEVQIRDGYDAVFHLETAAVMPDNIYSHAGNPVRCETTDEALRADGRVLCAWTGHPHLRMIGTYPVFADKVQRLIAEIEAFLCDLEIERKYLIRYPNLAVLEKLPNCCACEIEQIYLNDGSRIRRRGTKDDCVYFQTVKQRISDTTRMEREWRISKEEYDRKSHLPNQGSIVKTRYCLAENHRYYEIDVFPFWDDVALMELELTDETEPVVFPSEITVLQEVTANPEYTNRFLAQRRKK